MGGSGGVMKRRTDTHFHERESERDGMKKCEMKIEFGGSEFCVEVEEEWRLADASEIGRAHV